MASLGDRQFQTHRRVRPGRLVIDGGNLQSQEFATAVVGIDGNSIEGPVVALLEELLVEQKRTNLLLSLLIEDEVSLSDV